MSNQLIIPNADALPVVSLPSDLLAKVQAQFAQAAANVTTSLPRLTFGGKMFNLSFGGGDPIELPDRTLDVHLVAIDPNFHYVFYEKAYTNGDSNKDGRMMSRYPLPTDSFEFTPTAEWAQRAYKQRAVVMLANDPEHKLYAVDFGYNTIKKVGNPQLGLLSLAQLVSQFDFFQRQNPQLLPFMFTIQLSFTKESVPEIQFSLTNQVTKDGQVRFATPAAIEAMVNAISNGEVDNLLKIEYDNAEAKNTAKVPVAQPVVQQPVVQQPVVQQPVVQQPVVQQPQTVQPVVQPIVQQPVAQPVAQQATTELAAL